MSEEILDDVKGMFDEGPHGRFRLLEGQQPLLLRPLFHLLDRMATAGNFPFDSARRILGFDLFALPHSDISRIGVDLSLLAMK
jgi:hypothetical protein